MKTIISIDVYKFKLKLELINLCSLLKNKIITNKSEDWTVFDYLIQN